MGDDEDLGDFEDFNSDDVEAEAEAAEDALIVAQTAETEVDAAVQQLQTLSDEYVAARERGDDAIAEELEDRRAELRRRLTPWSVDPLARDFKIGDPVVDLATGRRMTLVGVTGETAEEADRDRPFDILDNYGNARLRVRRGDPMYTCIYTSQVGTSPPGKKYDMPSSRLGRPVYENVDGVDRVFDTVARAALASVFESMYRNRSIDDDEIVATAAHVGGVESTTVDEALEMAEAAVGVDPTEDDDGEDDDAE